MSVLAFKEHRGFCYEYIFASKGYKTHNSFQALGVLKQQKLKMISFWELGLLPLLLNSQNPSTSWTAVIIETNHHWLKLQFCYKSDESLGFLQLRKTQANDPRGKKMGYGSKARAPVWPQSCRQKEWGSREIKTTLYFQLKFFITKLIKHQIKNNLLLIPRHWRTTLSQILLTEDKNPSFILLQIPL